MVVAARRNEQRTGIAPDGDVEAELVAVEALGGLEIANNTVWPVTPVGADGAVLHRRGGDGWASM